MLLWYIWLSTGFCNAIDSELYTIVIINDGIGMEGAWQNAFLPLSVEALNCLFSIKKFSNSWRWYLAIETSSWSNNLLWRIVFSFSCFTVTNFKWMTISTVNTIPSFLEVNILTIEIGQQEFFDIINGWWRMVLCYSTNIKTCLGM